MSIPTSNRDQSPGHSRRPTRIVACAFAALAVVALAACGDDDDAGTATEAAAGGQAVTITLSDYVFEGVPSTITSGTPIEVTNESADEAHELTAFRLPDTETRSLAELQALPPDEFGALVPGAPALAFAARPNEDGELVLGDGTLHEPGRYLLVCFIPTGADPDQVMTAMQAAAADPSAGPPQIEGGPPHVAAGMIAELVVTP
jgi:plastocyanin